MSIQRPPDARPISLLIVPLGTRNLQTKPVPHVYLTLGKFAILPLNSPCFPSSGALISNPDIYQAMYHCVPQLQLSRYPPDSFSPFSCLFSPTMCGLGYEAGHTAYQQLSPKISSPSNCQFPRFDTLEMGDGLKFKAMVLGHLFCKSCIDV